MRDKVKCAKWCGRGCTRAEYDDAVMKGRELADSMKSIAVPSLRRRWIVKVWENLGWHYAVVSPCGRITVHAHSYLIRGWPNLHYTAYLEPKGGGTPQWVGRGDIPEQAVLRAIRAAKKSLKVLGAVLVDL